MMLHLPSRPSTSSSSSSGLARTDTLAANSSTTTTTVSSDEDDFESLFGENDSPGQDSSADSSVSNTTPPTEEDDNDSLFGEGEFPDQDNLAGSGTSNEAEEENELTLVNTAAAPRMMLQLPSAPAAMAQEETVAGSSFSNETVGEEIWDWDALLRDVGLQGHKEFYSSLQFGAEPEAAVEQPATPVQRGRGRPPGKKPKVPGPKYRCRYGCDGHRKAVDLRRHMMRVHGVYSNKYTNVEVCRCGRRVSYSWKELTCTKRDSMCKKLVEGTEEWYRHHVSEPRTEQEAADTFAYEKGIKPSELVVVRPEHNEGERQMACAAALACSDEAARVAAEAAAAAEAATAAAQVNNGPSAAGSSQDCAVALDDDSEEDAEWEEDDDYEQGPPAKRRRM